MSEEDDEQDSGPADIEARIEQLEDQVGDVSVDDLKDRLQAIERHQERLESNIDSLAQRTREESEQTPHIDSVKQLYRSLEQIEEQMSRVSEQVDELGEDDE